MHAAAFTSCRACIAAVIVTFVSCAEYAVDPRGRQSIQISEDGFVSSVGDFFCEGCSPTHHGVLASLTVEARRFNVLVCRISPLGCTASV